MNNLQAKEVASNVNRPSPPYIISYAQLRSRFLPVRNRKCTDNWEIKFLMAKPSSNRKIPTIFIGQYDKWVPCATFTLLCSQSSKSKDMK